MITHRRHARYEPDHRKNPRRMKIPIKQLARGRARQEGELVALAGGAQAPRRLGAGSDRSGRAGGPTLWFSTSTIPTCGDLWLDQYVFVAGRRLVKTVLIGGVKLVDDCALCARAAIVSRYRKVVARIAGRALI